jgi:hypothetical protein
MFVKYGNQYTQVFEYIRMNYDTVNVYQDDFKSGTHRMHSEGFARCIGLAFVNYSRTRGALAHLSPGTPPELFCDGYVGHVMGSYSKPVERLESIFEDPQKVRAVQIFDANCYAWHPDDVAARLRTKGFTDFSAVALRNTTGKVYHKTISLDVKKGLIHIGSTINRGIMTIPLFSDVE